MWSVPLPEDASRTSDGSSAAQPPANGRSTELILLTRTSEGEMLYGFSSPDGVTMSSSTFAKRRRTSMRMFPSALPSAASAASGRIPSTRPKHGMPLDEYDDRSGRMSIAFDDSSPSLEGHVHESPTAVTA